ncbi:unnamed protein product [Ectocarpus sp. CCAP 1310/34]|nr:unnamed protein product [Ectocarpus sp. CCAP 1310/34]
MENRLINKFARTGPKAPYKHLTRTREGAARVCALMCPAVGHNTTPLRGPTLEHMPHDTPEQQPGGEATQTSAAAAAAAEKNSSISSGGGGGGSSEVEPGSLPQFSYF